MIVLVNELHTLQIGFNIFRLILPDNVKEQVKQELMQIPCDWFLRWFWFLQEWYSKRIWSTVLFIFCGTLHYHYGQAENGSMEVRILATGDDFSHFGYFLKSSLSIPFLGILLISWAWPFLYSIYHKWNALCLFLYPGWLGFYWCWNLLELLGRDFRWRSWKIAAKNSLYRSKVAGPIGGLLLLCSACLWILDSYPSRLYLFGSSWICDPEFQGYGEDVLNLELGGNNCCLMAMDGVF